MKKQADGRYKSKIVVGYDADGEPIKKYVSGRTKKEFEQNRQETVKRFIGGGIEVQRDILFETYAKEWVAAYKNPESDSAWYNINIALDRLLGVFANRQMRSITSMDIQNFAKSLTGKGRTTITDATSLLRGIFTQAYADGVIDRNPAAVINKPKTTTKKRREFTDSETAAVLHHAARDKYGLMLYLLYYTGMRIGEVLGLTWAEVDLSKNEILVRRDVDFKTGRIGDVKTENSMRDIPIFDPLKIILNEHRQIGGYVISASNGANHLSPSGYRKIYKHMAYELVEIDDTIEQQPDGADPDNMISVLTAHYFRHNFASLLYDAGVDVLSAQRWLGHSDPATTLRIYSHLKKEREKESVERVNALCITNASLMKSKNM